MTNETTYLNLVKHVLDNGEQREDRTGVGTLSVFGYQCRYDLQQGFPLLTTKRVNFKAIVQELLWFLRGETNIKTLGCGIWDQWCDEDGDCGPIYGFAWRHFGAIYEWPGAGIDQIAALAESLRVNPHSRRHMVTAWNPSDVHKVVLPPCHVLFQCYVRNGEYLDLQLYQRSADIALGVPFNIASYSLLCMMLAKAVGLKPGHFIHTLGDAHIYTNHVEGLTEQVLREPFAPPTVEIVGMPDFSSADKMTMAVEDFKLKGYKCHPAIRFEVAV